jgi:hypothetical protein
MEKFKQITHLRWLRLSLGQTLAIASASCGVTRVNFALIDGGRLKPTVRDAQKLEAYFGVPIDVLIGPAQFLTTNNLGLVTIPTASAAKHPPSQLIGAETSKV